MNHLSYRFCDKRAHFSLAHELVHNVENNGSLLEAQLLKDAVILGYCAIEQVCLVNLIAIHRFVIFGSALEVVPEAQGQKLACAWNWISILSSARDLNDLVRLKKLNLSFALGSHNHSAVMLLPDYLDQLEVLLRCQSRERFVKNHSSIRTWQC